MTPEEFRSKENVEEFSPALRALWCDAHGEWDQAHELAQSGGDSDGDWVHAYLHRKEGDESNARYWYQRARRVKPNISLEAEWSEILDALLRKEKS